MRNVPLCSVSIDLDEIACYLQIHSLKSTGSIRPVYDIALTRIRRFAADHAVPLTLFVVARDLDRAQNVTQLATLVADGHEIGNHSLDHFYDLTRRGRGEQEFQIRNANQRIADLLGVTPTGFRAPGYTVTDQLLNVVAESGLRYDTSVFPCPAYFAAKAARLFGMRLRDTPSSAILDSPRVLAAPRVPYRIGHPYWRVGQGLLELPIQVAGAARMPFIGTSLSMLGPRAAQMLTRLLVGAPFINLELLGIDFLDSHDVPSELRAVQPDLRIPLARKLETFAAVFAVLRDGGYTMVRLDEAAQQFE